MTDLLVLSESNRSELRSIARQPAPVWGGALRAGDPELHKWASVGLIEAVGEKGYRITAKGRRLSEPRICPHCKHPIP